MNGGYFPYYYPPAYYPHPMPREQQIYPQYDQEKRFHPLPIQNQDEDMDRQQDFGNSPYVVNIENAVERNRAFRRAIWTGRHLQVTLMNIRPGEDIGLERHQNTDQFLRIEEGRGVVQMGDRPNQLTFERRIADEDAIMIPAGKWHNIRNTGRDSLKLYSIYAPPEHRRGTIHRTKADATHREENNQD